VIEPTPGSADVPRLVTERLVLRAFEDGDAEAYHALFNDAEVTRYLPMKGEPVGMERVVAAIGRGRQHWTARGYGIWAVEDGSSGVFLGQCGLQFLEDGQETELLYALARQAWGRGLATEAAGATVRFGFGAGGLDRIVAYAVPENVASTRVLTKLGMRSDGEVDIFGLHCLRFTLDRKSGGRSPGRRSARGGRPPGADPTARRGSRPRPPSADAERRPPSPPSSPRS
jgi:RimJ/RimL family protein N-acetyltransferase